MLTLISGGDVYAPAPLGAHDILISGSSVAAIGAIDRRALDALGVAFDFIDATGCAVVPGLIDPHEHLTGGSGEHGYASQTPEIRVSELIEGGITTVVGCLGADTSTKTMPALLARVNALRGNGVSAYMYSGGYTVPPATLTGSVRTDIMYIEPVIGAGEIAISDSRSTHPTVPELSRLVRDAAVGGSLSGKAGVTHFHVGDEPSRLAPIRALLDDCHLDPAQIYPTHVERSEALMDEAVAITHRGVTVDIDVVEGDLARWLRYFIDAGGDFDHLTASSDASVTRPASLFDEVRACIRELRMPLERVWPIVSSNTARVLKLPAKGRLAVGADADVLVLRRDSLELTAMVAQGRVLFKDGDLLVRETWLAGSDRRFSIHGEKEARGLA